MKSELEKDLDFCLEKYNKLYNFDMNYIKIKESSSPRFIDGKINIKMKKEEFGGCWTKKKIIYINNDLKKVMNFYGVKGSLKKFRLLIIAHELAHEIYENLASEEFKTKIKDKVKKENFTTIYLKTVNEEKYDKEAFCEYLAHTITKEKS